MLEEFKNYLRVYDDEDDNMISSFIDVAVEYVNSTTGKEFSLENKKMKKYSLFLLLVKKIVADLYENRGTGTDVKRDIIVTTILDSLSGDNDV